MKRADLAALFAVFAVALPYTLASLCILGYYLIKVI
jgi:hypothetical protein